MATRRALPPAGLSLQHFIVQSQLLHAYRAAVRTTRPIPDSQSRRETLNYLRSDLERLRLVNDLSILRDGLSSFQRSIKTLSPTFGLTGLSPDQGGRLIGRGGRRSVGL